MSHMKRVRFPNFMSKNPSRRAGRGEPFHTQEAWAYHVRILAEEEEIVSSPLPINNRK
jgi:hypothetical protein